MAAAPCYEKFRAMSLFLDQFAARAGDDLATLVSDISVDVDGGTFDRAARDDWIACVRLAKGVDATPGEPTL